MGWIETHAFNRLLRNDRGRFREVTAEAGLLDSLPTDNALWLDYDRDGFIDLYTGNLSCGDHPDPEVRNLLYRNQGDGTFIDMTEASGLHVLLKEPDPNDEDDTCIGGSNGGMVAGDFDDDGWPDLYIGVLLDRNRLFLNRGNGTFIDATTGEIDDVGEAFGVAVGDYDNDGFIDLFLGAGPPSDPPGRIKCPTLQRQTPSNPSAPPRPCG